MTTVLVPTVSASLLRAAASCLPLSPSAPPELTSCWFATRPLCTEGRDSSRQSHRGSAGWPGVLEGTDLPGSSWAAQRPPSRSPHRPPPRGRWRPQSTRPPPGRRPCNQFQLRPNTGRNFQKHGSGAGPRGARGQGAPSGGAQCSPRPPATPQRPAFPGVPLEGPELRPPLCRGGWTSTFKDAEPREGRRRARPQPGELMRFAGLVFVIVFFVKFLGVTVVSTTT